MMPHMSKRQALFFIVLTAAVMTFVIKVAASRQDKYEAKLLSGGVTSDLPLAEDIR